MSSGRASGGPSRGAVAPTWSTWTRDGAGAILVILALGLAFRLILAYSLHGSGFAVDLVSFRGWASDLATNGLQGFYQRPGFHDYTPGYLYVLYVVGLLGKASGGVGDLIKIPPILADVALGWLVWSMARELGAGRKAALLGGALVVINPVSWFDSVVWGQVDSFGLLFLLLGVRELWHDRPERSAILAVIAALIKPQLAILVPILAAVTIRRALWPPAGAERRRWRDDGRATDAGVIRRFLAWERRTDRPIRIVTTGLTGFLTVVALCYPFGLSVIESGKNGQLLQSGLLEQVFKTAAGYPYASVNAFNPWAFAQAGGSGVAATGTWACDSLILKPIDPRIYCPTAVMIGPFEAVYVGAALLAAAFVIVTMLVAWRPERLVILLGVTGLAVAFFMLPTRVHERYLYPFMGLGAILAAFSWRWRIAYVALSATTLLNMYVVLTTIYSNNPSISDWFRIGPTLRTTNWVAVIVLVNVAVTLWLFVQLRPGAGAALREELEDSAREGDSSRDLDWSPLPEDRPGRLPAPERETVRATGRRMAELGMPSSAPAAEAIVRPPTWSPAPSFAELGPIGWFRAKLAQRPIRPDRSGALEAEPGGRFDRLDLWILAVLVVSLLGIRMFRLSDPYQMHFDEVYHARTATEFLQDWRYGISHDIYEWTHPHLAKYAMAGGLVAWGDDRVTATSELGVPVVDALIEPRRAAADLPSGIGGDRLDIVTGSQLRSYDLTSRQLVASVPIDGAVALAQDPAANRLYIGLADGEIVTFDLNSLDAVQRASTPELLADPVPFGRVDGRIVRMYAPNDGLALLAVTDDDRVITLDAASLDANGNPTTAVQIGSTQLDGVADIGPAGTLPTLTGKPDAVADPSAAAAKIAELLGGSAADYQRRLESSNERIVLAGISGDSERTKVQDAIDNGPLAGLAIDSLPQVGVADRDGIELISPATGDLTDTVGVGGPAHGFALITVGDSTLYVTTDPDTNSVNGQAGRGQVAIVAVGGTPAKNGPALLATMPLPAPGSSVLYDDATEMVHVLGRTPDRSASTVYVIEPHARAVYADARLPFDPATVVIDSARPYPTDDRQQILALDAGGGIASVDIGKHEFAWRFPGMLAGVAMAALLYVLARILFRRRAVALFVGVLCAADGMLFVQSRIGMNDAYVGLGIVAAYTIFAALWTGAWKSRGAFWIGMPLIGICLGLALSSKWVALYAIGGMGLMILARGALGRLLVIAGLVAVTAILGYVAINVPENSGLGNLPFVAIMIGLTMVAVLANVLHPLSWSLDEIRLAVGGPAALGGLVLLASIAAQKATSSFRLGSQAITPIEIALALVAMSLAAWAALAGAARLGLGPLAPPPAPTDAAALLPPPAPPSAASWLRPGAQLGLPLVWMVACLLILPVAIYILSYVPWAFVENHQLFAGWPPGHTGETLFDRTLLMYAYHNNLADPHPASSPWWAWLFDLKPVWFYQQQLAGNTTAAIYDAGNLPIWWLGLPALGFVAWQAFARRSLPLALIGIGFAFQWVSWARIDRAAFQYHYYTSLPFLVLALGYFLAELWHGASRRTWLLARLAAGVAVLGPGLMWIFERPFCGFVGGKDLAASAACPPIIPSFVLTTQTLALAVVVGVSILVVLRQLTALRSDEADGAFEDRSARGLLSDPATRHVIPLIATAVVAIVASYLIRQRLDDDRLLIWTAIPVEPVAMVLILPAVLIAVYVATARDARRFVGGALVAIVGWFIVVYPNFAALPLPTAIANVYQGVLPTYLYDFKFPVNNVANKVPLNLFGPVPLLLAASLIFLAVVVAYSAWIWRLAIAQREADDREASNLGGGYAPGGEA